MKKRLALTMSLVCFLVACAASNDKGGLPTLATLPTPIGQEISLATPSPTNTHPPPTFTLVPSISVIDQELTRVFGDPSIYQSVVDKDATSQAVAQIPYRAMQPQHIEAQIEHSAYVSIGFEIIQREMVIEGIESSLYGGTGFKDSYRIFYNYVSPDKSLDILQRIPDTLCGLKDAGLVNQYVRIVVGQNSLTEDPHKGYLFCFAPETMQSLNCSAPTQMDLDAMQSRPVTLCED